MSSWLMDGVSVLSGDDVTGQGRAKDTGYG